MTSDIFVLFFEFMSIFNIAFSLFLNKNNRDKSYILSFITIYNIYALIFFVLSTINIYQFIFLIMAFIFNLLIINLNNRYLKIKFLRYIFNTLLILYIFFESYELTIYYYNNLQEIGFRSSLLLMLFIFMLLIPISFVIILSISLKKLWQNYEIRLRLEYYRIKFGNIINNGKK